MTWVRYTIVLIILIIIAIAVIKSGKRDFKIEANKLVELLGGKKNIVTIEASMSRFKATLKDVSLANKDGIQKLGAKGIVEIDNQLKIVFDSDAVKLKKCIEDLLKQNAIRK
jgi:glucose-like phosphotransferase system IIB component